MPKACEVAAELRRVADALDKEPEAKVRQGGLWFHCYEKEHFLSLAHLMPRPFKKTLWTPGIQTDIRLTYETPALTMDVLIEQNSLCTLVEPALPAVYKCDPILSEIEEAALEARAGQL